MAQPTGFRQQGLTASGLTGEKSRERDAKAFKGKGGLATLAADHKLALTEIEQEMRQLAGRTQAVKAPCYLHYTNERGRAPRLRWRMLSKAAYFTFQDCGPALSRLAPVVADFFMDSASRADELNLMAKIHRDAVQALEKHLTQRPRIQPYEADPRR
ncbi:hypothetical protein [Achromobacter aloeverae]